MISLHDETSSSAPVRAIEDSTKVAPPNAWLVSQRWMETLEERLKSALDHSPGISQAGRYHLTSGGKRLRGRLALAGGLSLGMGVEDLLPAAAGVELLHNASLVHDDLQDGDVARRGHETVWKRFGKDTALLLGDAMIAAAFAEAAQGPSRATAEVARSMSRCVGMLADGQRMDTAPPNIEHWTPAAYETLARLKTGKLFALALDLPMVLACATLEQRQASALALEWIGVGFQIRDDLRDLFGSKGRPKASDLRSRRMSAILVQYLRVAEPAKARRLAWRVDGAPRPPERDLELGIEEILASGALSACLTQLRAALANSEQHLCRLPGALRTTLRGIGTEILRESEALVARPTLGDAQAHTDGAEVSHVRRR